MTPEERIDVDEWPFLRDSIDRMFVEIAENEKSEGQAPPASNDDGWIPWSGGECPVSGDKGVIVRLRGGYESIEVLSANHWEWHWFVGDPEVDIIAYKVAE